MTIYMFHLAKQKQNKNIKVRRWTNLSLKPNILDVPKRKHLRLYSYQISNVLLAQWFSEFRIQISFYFRLLSPYATASNVSLSLKSQRDKLTLIGYRVDLLPLTQSINIQSAQK